jgi:hypothetical protein
MQRSTGKAGTTIHCCVVVPGAPSIHGNKHGLGGSKNQKFIEATNVIILELKKKIEQSAK